ncbi:DUF1543 domain-containing protein [Lentimicrobium sp. S6]|uniref:DUF1543 domain-containing protein n=1 Tax=Lentimicrobium sp. S6 TaxID=2735872 RepID=UPI001555BC75|nr:DUF1543 domain-containing protein [Lentimicrobium sp. S6]NPD44404.1 DUF1543 domain-containing protein [Lentimicrobium sp. S6]
MEKHLYAILLGGKLRANHLMEDHNLVFVIAENEPKARKLAKHKWQAEEVHVDGTQRIDQVDGFKIKLEKQEGETSKLSTNSKYSL